MNVENDIIQTELIEKDILLNRKCFIRFLMDKNNIRLCINIFYKTFQVFSFYRIAEKLLVPKIRSSNKHYLRPDKCNDLRPSIVKKTYTLEDINYDIPF